MAQLKDSLVAGDLRVTGKIYGTATNSDKVNNLTVLTAVPANAKFTDTTYTSKTAASGGTEVSLVTTGEKYTWNNKSNFINEVYKCVTNFNNIHPNFQAYIIETKIAFHGSLIKYNI